jgi:hypothetical protein
VNSRPFAVRLTPSLFSAGFEKGTDLPFDPEPFILLHENPGSDFADVDGLVNIPVADPVVELGAGFST